MAGDGAFILLASAACLPTAIFLPKVTGGVGGMGGGPSHRPATDGYLCVAL